MSRRLRGHGDEADHDEEPAPGPATATCAYSTGYLLDGEEAATAVAADVRERQLAAAGAMAAQWDQDKRACPGAAGGGRDAE